MPAKVPIAVALAMLLSFIVGENILKAQPPGFSEQSLYQSILDQPELNKKINTARQLAKNQTNGSRELLLKLLEADSYWDREAAVYGLFDLKSNIPFEPLLEKLLDDHMIRGTIASEFKKNINTWYPLLEKEFQQRESWNERQILLDVIAAPSCSVCEKFVKSNIDLLKEEPRIKTFQVFCSTYGRENLPYVKSFVDDPELSLDALSFLITEEQRKELPLFLQIARTSQRDDQAALAFKAIDLWADFTTREQIFYDALGTDSEVRIQNALIVFRDLISDRVKDRLASKTIFSSLQLNRMLAAEILSSGISQSILPLLIPALKEEFIQRERTAADMVGSIFSVGILPLMSDISEISSKKEFNRIKKTISNRMNKWAGVDFGSDYAKWVSWAVYQGYTVDGKNLFTYLFSSDANERSEAISHGCRLLGCKDVTEFNLKFFTSATPDFADQMAELTRQLIKKGVLKDRQPAKTL